MSSEPLPQGEEFLSRRQRRNPIVLPADASEEDLAQSWTLSGVDKREALRCRGEAQRRRFAVQLCTLAAYGRFLRPQDEVPVGILNHVSWQLGLPAVIVADPPPKEDADYEHQQRIKAHLGFRTFDTELQDEVERWIYARALEGRLPRDIFEDLEEELLRRKVVLPAPSTLERIVAGVCARAREEIFAQVERILTEVTRAQLDSLIEMGAGRTSPLFRFKAPAPEAKPEAIGDFVDQLRELEALGVSEIDLGSLSAEMTAYLSDLGGCYDARDLRRFGPAKRHTLLACYMVERYRWLLDQLVEMNAQYLTGMSRRAEGALARRRRRFFPLRRVRQTLDTLRDGMRTVLDRFEHEEVLLRSDFFDAVDRGKARQAVEDYEEFRRLEERGYVDGLVSRYSHLRRYLPQFFSLPLEAQPGSEHLLEAIEIARTCPTGKPLPENAPERVVPPKLQPWARKPDGSLDRRVWEIGLAMTVRDRFKSGDLYLASSKRHVSFSNMIYNDTRWAKERPRAYADLSLPLDPKAVLGRLRSEFEEVARAAEAGLSSNTFGEVLEDGLHLHRGQEDRYQPSPSVKNLRLAIESRFPKVHLATLLWAVNARCGFLEELKPRGGYDPRVENLPVALLAALVAQGTNLGLAQMASHNEEVSVETLQHVAKWYLREDTIRAANAVIVDYMHRLPLSAVWGEGMFSSSDGQRFGIRGRSLLGSFYPRYYGYYERAVTVYTHVSDQFSVFRTQAISCSEREAMYVLEGLLENDTILKHREHTADTHGYTDHLFGLCFLLGYSFMPRIAGLGHQQLYKMDRGARYGGLEPVFQGVADVGIIEEQWDQLVRLTASMKHRTAKTQDVMQRLINSSPSDRLAKALTALSQVVKTVYVLRYIHDPELRGRVQLQLNRGEARHALARRIFFAELGEFLRGDYEEVMNKASCLSLLSNAVTAWNIVKMTEIVDELRHSGTPLSDEDLAHVWPLSRGHVGTYGTYRFNPPASAA